MIVRNNVITSASCIFVGWFVPSFVIFWRPNISKAVGDRGSGPMDYQEEMAYGESNGHLIDHVT